MFNLQEYASEFEKISQDLQNASVSVSNPEEKVASVTDVLALNPDAISREEIISDLNDLCLCYLKLETGLQKQVVYIVCNSVITQAEYLQKVLESSDTDQFELQRQIIQSYGYLLHVLLTNLGADNASVFQGITGNKKPAAGVVAKFKNNCKQVENCLDAIYTLLKSSKLDRLFETTPERDLFVSLFTRPIYSLMEIEQRLKVDAIKMLMFRIICVCVKYHGHGALAQASIVQNLTYFSHLTGPMAQLLHILADEYGYVQLTDETLQEVSNKQFNANDNNGPRSISQFIIKLSEVSPQLVMKQMLPISKLLDNNSHSLRSSVVEACGNIIVNVCSQPDGFERHQSQVETLLDLIEARFMDQNPFVRSKAAQALIKIVDLDTKFVSRRLGFMETAVRSLDDKSALVRRNCVKLMSRLVLYHPFAAIHGTSLRLSTWKARLSNIQTQEEDQGTSRISVEALEEDQSESKSDTIKRQLTIKYYEDAIKFIELCEKGAARTAKLLHSRNKNEVLEAMDWFVLADAYNINNAKLGIRKMLHLVWMKGTSDDGSDITAHLFECYKNLFLTAPSNATNLESAAYVAKNLISLTYKTSDSDLASLEKLLSSMYEEEWIDNTVVKILWQIYGDSLGKKLSQKQRQGAIIVLGMLSLANHEVSARYVDVLLKCGFTDDMVLAKYTCIALSRVNKTSKEDQVLQKVSDALTTASDDDQWYPFAEQAINAIYSISSRPDIACSKLIRKKIVNVWADADGDIKMDGSKPSELAQLLFLVGHVAIKTMIHLEKCEAQFKKKKIEQETEKSKKKEQLSELEMIGGTSEDDFSDAVTYIKERELLYSENSLLAKFGPLVKEICCNNIKYESQELQRAAVLCMEKLMCVSSRYCEENLPLLITLMEKSPDPVIRSNAVLGLGDMTVCFNNLVDENTDYLYRRLDDENIMVQRTCLMTVTFLILAGQVKVKGQLATMAKCLENADHGISDMCRLFFTELATKDNAIYNGFIDIFSGLSHDKDLAKDSMKRILRFLIGFIEKEKQQKQLSDKLVTRLLKAKSEEEWKDVAFVLQTLPAKVDKATEAISEGYKMVSVRD